MNVKEQKNTENRLLVFDFDGTLVDTFNAHYGAWQKVLGIYDIKISSSLLRHLLREGLDSEKIARSLGIKDKLASVIADKKRMIYSEIAVKKAKLYPYAKKVIKTLYERGYILCILTTSDRIVVEKILSKYKLNKYFSFIIGREDVNYPKPHPESIYLAIKKLEEKLGKKAGLEIFYIGDSKSDSALSKAIGCPFILFLSPYQGKQKISVKNNIQYAVAIKLLKDLLDIFPPLV